MSYLELALKVAEDRRKARDQAGTDEPKPPALPEGEASAEYDKNRLAFEPQTVEKSATNVGDFETHQTSSYDIGDAEYARIYVYLKAHEQKKDDSKSIEAERRFSQPHARLFSLLGRKVWTPEGPGTLLQAFADRVTVLLDCKLSQCAFFSPDAIRPITEDCES